MQHLGQRGTIAPWGHCPLSERAKLHRQDRPLGSMRRNIFALQIEAARVDYTNLDNTMKKIIGLENVTI